MPKILLSWMAYGNDFVKEKESFKGVNLEGPSYTFHQYFYKELGYDEHIILYTQPRDESWIEWLINKLLLDFSCRSINQHCADIKDPIDLEEVKGKIE